jgi:hypothetical protein
MKCGRGRVLSERLSSPDGPPIAPLGLELVSIDGICPDLLRGVLLVERSQRRLLVEAPA